MTTENHISFELDIEVFESLKKIAFEKGTTVEKLIQVIIRESLFSAGDDWK